MKNSPQIQIENDSDLRGSLLFVFAAMSLVGTLLLPGCISSNPNQTARVAPRKLTRAESWNAAGWLKVYSAQAWESVNDEPVSYVHSDYKVLTPEGRLILNVQNAGPMGEPETVRMDPGAYVVVAQASQRGTVKLPVIIKTGRTTTLHLDAEARRKSKQYDSQN